MPSQLLPEVFALIGINVFLALSLLAFLLRNRFPRVLLFVYQIAAVIGLGFLVISKVCLAYSEEYVRLWCSFTYLIVALTNVVALNSYVAVAKRLWTIAGVWSGAVTFPSILISAFFVSEYSSTQGGVFLSGSQTGFLVLGLAVGVGLTLSHSLKRAKLLQGEEEVK
jgi:hypothetical protein